MRPPGPMPTQPDPSIAPAGSGLTEAEARRRLDALGERGELPTSRSYTSIVRANTLTLFNLILGSFLVLILLAGRPADALFAAVLVANTAIGILQEVRAKRTLDRLALLVAPYARVVRDGASHEVAAADVVPGDLVMVQPGDQIVADGTVARSVGLMLDESPLTGESHAVERREGEVLLSGSLVVKGAGSYVVEAAGEASYAARSPGSPASIASGARRSSSRSTACSRSSSSGWWCWEARSRGCSSITTCRSARRLPPPPPAS